MPRARRPSNRLPVGQPVESLPSSAPACGRPLVRLVPEIDVVDEPRDGLPRMRNCEYYRFRPRGDRVVSGKKQIAMWNSRRLSTAGGEIHGEQGGNEMRNIVYLGVATALACLWGSGASAQSGAINKAVGGYSFEDAAKEAPDHEEERQAAHFRDHHPHRGQRVLRSGLCRRAGRRQRLRHQSDRSGLRSADRRHPARNPDPQPDRQRPDHQRRDHDDAAGRRLQRHRQEAGGTRRRRRDHQFLRRHAAGPQQHQPHRPGRVGGGDRRRGDRQMPAQEQRQGRLDPVPEHGAGRQYRSEQSRHRGVPGDAEGAEGSQPPAGLQGRRRPEQHRRRRRHRHHRRPDRATDRKPQGRGRPVRTQWRRHARRSATRSRSSS